MAERKARAESARGSSTGKGKAKPKGKGGVTPKVKPSKSKADQAAQRKRRAAERKAKAEADRRAGEMALAKDGLVEEPKPGAVITLERASTYLEVFKDWCKGLTGEALASKHGLGIRRCEQIVAELRDARVQALQINDPLFGLRLAHDLLIHYRAAISEYAQLAESAGTQASVKIAALRERDRAQEAFKLLAQELGLVPKHLGTLRVQEDFLALVDALLDQMDEEGLALDVQRRMIEAVEMRATTGGDGKLRIAASSGDVDGSAEEVQTGAAAA